jgi:hypothetical protein
MTCEYKRAFYAALKKSCPKGKMVCLCCVCLKALGYVKSAAPEFDGEVSHGLCPVCAKKLYPQFCDDQK